ncbi:putative acyltransferase [Neolecta irregularis DAH-3]|uniref:Putative acyltransferase n=1 Tax=Neolecta irregularis (strain DAH-3) TaxID=1198029 RepID=A0A1U7LHH4_NEOID|nr:putative acyltransferase [Neolecta irregularis DAH-3]|eukprot:OLL22078.1 putative acyltransferase [Neolecta irregularis DAH-3]
MRQVRLEAGRRVSFLIAEKSMKRMIIGALARAMQSIPVARAQDLAKPGTGKIRYASAGNPLKITGQDTTFTSQLQPQQIICLPGVGESAEIASIESDTELTLVKGFVGSQAKDFLSSSTKFKYGIKISQNRVYEVVYNQMDKGACIGIFPEGGSHDRPDLLPLKGNPHSQQFLTATAGVAIMALGALARNPESGLTIVPCGMNYFHAHRFRSRAVIEFGNPLEIPPELIAQYQQGDTEKRKATSDLLALIADALRSVTVTTPDYETLQVIQAGRRLYKPARKKLPLPQIVELNRRFISGYEHVKNDPRVASLRQQVLNYNRQLYILGIRDHQVQNQRVVATHRLLLLLLWRTVFLIWFGLAALPGTLLFSPVFIATKVISKRKASEALKASTVKISGKDVLGSWKVLVAIAMTPILYTYYSLVTTFIVWKMGIWPEDEWRSLWIVPALTGLVLPSVSFFALRFGESGLDIWKSIRPLFMALNPKSASTIQRLRQTREQLATQLTEMINTLGPEIFPDFDASRVIAASELPSSTTRISSISSKHHMQVPVQDILPRNESFANIGFFASQPPSRTRSRNASVSGGVEVSQLSQLDSSVPFDELNRRISAEMQQRRQQRRKSSDSNMPVDIDPGLEMTRSGKSKEE